jgi:hypothetical protein
MNPYDAAVLTRLGGGHRKPRPLQRTTRIALAVLLVLSHPLWAATIIVDETTCTLVDAITAANTDTAIGGCTAGSGADTIELTTDVTLTDVNNGSNGLPVVESEISVSGGGFTIERDADAPPFSLFLVSATLSLNDVVLAGGGAGSVITNLGDLTLTNSTVSGGGAYYGGGIFNSDSGTATLMHTAVLNNFAYANGGGVGGGIYNLGTLNLTSSTVSGNYAQTGGGGIWSNGSGSVTTLTDSTVSGNSVYHFGGGGIWCYEGVLTLTNSTVSGNSLSCNNCSGSERGGGIRLTHGQLTLTNSTVSGNSTFGSGGIFLPTTSPAATLTNSIVANNTGNCSGPITDNGNNFSDDDSCGGGFADITPGVDFDISRADNGGPTQTHALLPWSVAIDAAGECGLDTDQRGFPRDDGQCDSGSFEFQAGTGTPASSRLGVLVTIVLVMMVSWAVLRSKRGGRDST